jgi:hypothetical protein
MMISKPISLALMMISLVAPACSFTFSAVGKQNGVPSIVNAKNQRQQVTDLNMSSSSSSSMSDLPLGRRDIIKKAGSAFIFASVVSSSSPAQAKSKDKEPVALSTVRASFQAVRDELSVGYLELGELIAKEDYEAIMTFTQEYDLEFRKAKMGKARKFLTSKEDKERAVSLCNAVTFDLIGMNKGCRPGQRNMDQVRKYYGELKQDIETFLEMEKLVDESQYVA